MYFVTGFSQEPFVLGLNGSERFALAFFVAAFKSQDFYRPVVLLSFSIQVLVACTVGHLWYVQWLLFVACLLSIRSQPNAELVKKKDGARYPAAAGQAAFPFHQRPTSTSNLSASALNHHHMLQQQLLHQQGMLDKSQQSMSAGRGSGTVASASSAAGPSYDKRLSNMVSDLQSHVNPADLTSKGRGAGAVSAGFASNTSTR